MGEKTEKWPRLTETLPHRDDGNPVYTCQGCGCLCGKGPTDRQIWCEHDDNDRPTNRHIVLCAPCAKRIIEPHPRLYGQVSTKDLAPGAMPICVDCVHRRGTSCESPESLKAGGEGLKFPPPDMTAHIQKCGPGGKGRTGGLIRVWNDGVPSCSGKAAKG